MAILSRHGLGPGAYRGARPSARRGPCGSARKWGVARGTRGFQYEARPHGGDVLLHLWSEQSNAVRRVLRITAQDEGRLEVEAARFGRTRPDRLEFLSAETRRQPSRVARERFRARFREWLAQQFPDEKIASLATAADLEHSLSGNYTRGILEAGSLRWVVLGAAPQEAAATYDALLTFGLMWLDRARQSAGKKPVAGLRLFFPAGAGRITAHRVQALSTSVAVELYEYSAESGRSRLVQASDAGNVETWLAPRREIDAALSQAEPEVERVRRLAPGAIEADVIPGTQEVALRFRGLLFARWQREGLFYGVGDPQRPLTPDRWPELTHLVQELDLHRLPLASSTRHPLYRAQPERWLQTLVSADPGRVDARLDPRFLYAQVPAFVAGDRGIMDLGGVTRAGRLAVLELKASEDMQLVLQAMDYWLRVRWHHAQQDFSRYGYFPGVMLDPRPPLLFLVAPSLRFHPANDVLLRYLSKEIEICRVGVSEHWRRGLRVVLRQERE
jgi:hypothetical protein